jgi:uncharacterized protein (DUF488 family)
LQTTLPRLYTFGYSGRTPDELQTLVEQLDMMVADIRFSPRSRLPDWSGGRLQKLLGDRYRHLPTLGNRNYKGGPVEFVDLETGVVEVGQLLRQQPVILQRSFCPVIVRHRSAKAVKRQPISLRSRVRVGSIFPGNLFHRSGQVLA